MGNSKPVEHDGEYVLTTGGGRDFGEVSTEISKKIRRQAGKIRLRIGNHYADNTGFGEKHIERPKRLEQLKQNGYQNARDIVQEIASGYNAIYKKGGRALIFVKHLAAKNKLIVAQLEPSANGDYYDVLTAHIARYDYFKNKEKLREKNFPPDEEGRSPTKQSPPSAISGHPTDTS